jgi:hypothetical protein
MGFSFGAKRRRQANQSMPQVRAMLAVASLYGPHSGSTVDNEQYVRLFETFSSLIPGASLPDAISLAHQAAAEAARSPYPLAVHAAWAVASLLPNSTITQLQRVMGVSGVTAGATVLTDEFPGIVKTAVLGRRTALWRGPAAVTVVLLSTFADRSGIRY